MTLSAGEAPARRVLIPLDIAKPPRPSAAARRRARMSGETMGTVWSVTLAAAAPEAPAALRHAIEGALDGVVAQMSTWIARSDIAAFNAAAPNTWHRLPDDFADVLDCALTVAKETGGAYDPTAGALTDLWGFGPGGPRQGVPPGDEIEAALARAGWQRLKRDGRDKVMQPGGLRLDLSSIAKGFAVDKVAECIGGFGIGDFLVEIGGELRGHGVKPDGTPWWVALERPAASTALPETVVALHELSIATSGDDQRYVERDGRRLSHILDPRNGYPVATGTASVTVLHRECMLADAWATALMVAEPREALALASARKLAARILVRAGAEWQELMTPAFAAMLA